MGLRPRSTNQALEAAKGLRQAHRARAQPLLRQGLRGECKQALREVRGYGHKRAHAQDLALDDLLAREELRIKPSELDEAKKAIEKELEACAHFAGRIKALQQDRDAMLAAFVESVPKELDRLAPEDHHRIYKMLRLRVEVGGGGRRRLADRSPGGEAVCKNGGTDCRLLGRYED